MQNRVAHRNLAGRVVAALSIAVLILAGLTAVVVRPVAAQTDPSCEDPDTVACIPATAGGDAGGGGAVMAPAPAAAAPAPGAAPAPSSAPYYPPCPVPVGPAPAAAPPAPPLYPCINDIYATLNRANLAYARAMRSLDSSELRQYWGQDALQDLLNQIATLRYTGSYRVLRLASIQVLEQSVGGSFAWVHTTEHWITTTYVNGRISDSSDTWYDNQYYLYRSGGRWMIGSDIVS